jgi:hypothetical protein
MLGVRVLKEAFVEDGDFECVIFFYGVSSLSIN